MAEMAHDTAERGEMDIRDQKSTFGHFLTFSLWGTLFTTMVVALLTVAFAMGYGWLAGVGAFAAIGVVAGFSLGMRGGWWGTVIGSTVVLALGGLVALFFG